MQVYVVKVNPLKAFMILIICGKMRLKIQLLNAFKVSSWMKQSNLTRKAQDLVALIGFFLKRSACHSRKLKILE